MSEVLERVHELRREIEGHELSRTTGRLVFMQNDYHLAGVCLGAFAGFALARSRDVGGSLGTLAKAGALAFGAFSGYQLGHWAYRFALFQTDRDLFKMMQRYQNQMEMARRAGATKASPDLAANMTLRPVYEEVGESRDGAQSSAADAATAATLKHYHIAFTTPPPVLESTAASGPGFFASIRRLFGGGK